MKKGLFFLLISLLLCGCASEKTPVLVTESTVIDAVEVTEITEPAETVIVPACAEIIVQEFAEDSLVPVQHFMPELLVELKYATSDNFTGSVIYDSWKPFLRYGTVQKLMDAEEKFRDMGLRLKLWDGFRPVSAQAKLWEIFPDKNYVSHPVTGNRNHCRGNAVDVTLCDAEGRELEMPSGFDDFTAQADWDFSDCSNAAAENAKTLRSVMESCGFDAYQSEWWHFTDGASYPVEEAFEPVFCSVCYADCKEYITLRVEPSTSAEAVTRIPRGDFVAVLAKNGDFSLVEYEGYLLGYVLSDYLAQGFPETEAVG